MYNRKNANKEKDAGNGPTFKNHPIVLRRFLNNCNNQAIFKSVASVLIAFKAAKADQSQKIDFILIFEFFSSSIESVSRVAFAAAAAAAAAAHPGRHHSIQKKIPVKILNLTANRFFNHAKKAEWCSK